MRENLSSCRIILGVLAVIWTTLSSSQAVTTGFNQTTVGPHDYNTAGNWVENSLPGNGIWDSSLTLGANQFVTFTGDTSLTTALNFNYAGNKSLTLYSSAAGTVNLTLGGDIGVNTSGGTSANVTIGNATQILNVNLGGTTRTMTVASGRTLTLQNVVSSGGIIKGGDGTLTLNGNNTYSGGTTISAGTNILGNANALGTSGTITLGSSGSGARLMIAGLTITRPITVSAGTGTVGIGAQGGTLSGVIALNRPVSLSGVNVYGGISGTGDVTIDSSFYSGYLITSFAAVSGGGVANTFNGNLYILSGATLNVGSGWASSISAIPDSSTVNVVGTLSILKSANGETIDALTGNGIVTAASSGGTLTIGSANGSGAFSGAIGGSGAIIVKTGIGTEIFSGVNTYTGTTTVNGGALLINSPGSLHASSAVSVNPVGWATLGGNGTINGSVAVAAGGFLAPGSASGTIGKLSLSSTLTLNGGFLAFDLNADTTAGTTYDQIAITSTLTMSGVNVIQLSSPSGSIAVGTYTLMTFASSTASTFKFPNGTESMIIGSSTLTLINGTTSLTLTVANASASVPPFAALTWKGNSSGTWDTSTANWLNSAAVSSAYAEGNQVAFDDTASGNFSVSGGTVSPLSVTVGNTVNAYTISAAIAGPTPLLKIGSGTLTLSGANTYSGGTTLSAGTLNLANTTALGATASTLTINGGAILDGNVTIANANAQNWNGDFTFSGTSGSLNLGTGAVTPSANRTVTVSANTLTVGGAIGGGAKSLTKLGDGTLILSGANTYSSTTTVGGGTLKIDAGAGGALNSSSPLTFNTGGGVFNYDNANAGGAKSQSLGALTFSAGDGVVKVTRTAIQNVFLTLASRARTAGASGNFVLTDTAGGGVNGTNLKIALTTPPTASVFIDQGTFFNGSSYAAYDSGGFVRAMNYTTDNSSAGGSVGSSFTTFTVASANGKHVDLGTAGIISAAGTESIKSLRIGGVNTVTVGAGNTLTIANGGILKTGSNASSISGGNAISPTVELVVRTDTSSDALTISTPVTGSQALTKSGAGTVTFSGANTYSGATKVDAGTLLVNNTHIVNSSTEAYTVLNAATLGGSGQIKLNQVITVNSGGFLAPGNGLNSSLKIDGGTKATAGLLTMSSGAKFSFSLDATGAGNPTMLDFWNYAANDLALNSNVVNLTLSGNHTPGTYTNSIFRFYSDTGSSATPHGISSGLTIGTVDSGISSPSIIYSANTIDVAYTILPGAADAMRSTLTPTSASITANGIASQILTVQAKDSYGNYLTSGGATVTITKSSGTGTIGSVTDNNNGTYTATVTAPETTGSGVFVATLGGDQVKSGEGSQTQAAVSYVSGPADHLTITSSISGLIAGDTREITAEIRDGTGNLCTGDSTSVHFSQSGAGSVSGLPADVAAVSGIATQQVTGSAGGSVTITAHVDGLTDGSTTFTVLQSSASAYSIQVSGSSSATTAAGSGVHLTVIALDGSGNTMTDFDSDKALSFYGLVSSPNSTAPTVTDKNGVARSVTSTVGLPNTTLTFVDGVADVGGVDNPVLTAYNGISSAVMLHCSDGTKSTESTHGSGLSLTVNPASASTLTVNGFPTSATAGIPGDVTVTAKDPYGNTDPSYAGTITFTVGVADTGKTVPSDFTFIPATHNGAHAFSGGVTLTKAVTGGGQSIIATDKNAGSINGTQSGITVNPGTANMLALDSGDGQLGSGSAALASPFVVKVTDVYNNLVPGVTVDFAVSTYPASATGQALSPASPATGSDGKASSTLTLGDKQGAYTVTATASVPNGSPVTFTATAAPIGSVIKAGTGTDLAAVGSWDGGAVPGSGNKAYWSSASLGANLTLGSSASWGSITVEGALTDIGITGAGTLTLGENGIDLSASPVNLSIGNPITLGAAQTWVVNSAKTLTASGIVGGSVASALVKDGAGTLTLLHTNTYGGDTTISNGTFEIGGAGQLGGGTYTGAITNHGLLRVNSSASQTLGGIVSGNGSLIKSSTGTLTLNGINTYSGGTTISAGTVIVGNTNALGSSGTITLGDVNSGANAITFVATANPYSCPFTVANYGGTVTLTTAGGKFSGAITLNRNVKLVPNSNNAANFDGGFSGSGDLTITNYNGYGVALRFADNTFTGNVYVLAGSTLSVGSSQALNGSLKSLIPDSSVVNVLGTMTVALLGRNETIDALTGSGSVTFGQVGDTLTVGGGNGSGTFSGVISTSGGIIKIGTGTQTLSGNNTYTGVTTISNGALKVSGGLLGNTAISLAGTGTLAIQPGSATAISAGNTATASAGATLNLGSRTFDMTDSAVSTFSLMQGSSFSGAALTITTGATLKFNLGNTGADLLAVTKAAAVSGTINVTLDATGAVSLTQGTFALITAASGLISSNPTWQFTGGGTTRIITIGGADYGLTLTPTDTAISVHCFAICGSVYTIR